MSFGSFNQILLTLYMWRLDGISESTCELVEWQARLLHAKWKIERYDR